ncbi:MAG: hypothetical protein R3B81_01635 [bacterium]
MKRNDQRLQLNRRTLRSLSLNDARQAAGGRPPHIGEPTAGFSCYTGEENFTCWGTACTGAGTFYETCSYI